MMDDEQRYTIYLLIPDHVQLTFRGVLTDLDVDASNALIYKRKFHTCTNIKQRKVSKAPGQGAMVSLAQLTMDHLMMEEMQELLPKAFN